MLPAVASCGSECGFITALTALLGANGMFEKSRLCSPLAILDLANPAIGCLSEMHRYLTISEVLATIGVAKLLAFAAMNPNMLLEVAARQRHLELVRCKLEARLIKPNMLSWRRGIHTLEKLPAHPFGSILASRSRALVGMTQTSWHISADKTVEFTAAASRSQIRR